jgi:hypothetical protein
MNYKSLIPHLDATIKFKIVSTYTMSPENKFPLSNKSAYN